MLLDYKKNPRAFCWNLWKLDPKLSQYSATDSRRDRQETKTEVVRGWMLPSRVAELNSVFASHPDYSQMTECLIKGLKSKEHANAAMSEAGYKLYYYEHWPDESKVTNTGTKSWEIVQNSDMKSGTFQQCIQNTDASTCVTELEDAAGSSASGKTVIMFSKWHTKMISMNKQYGAIDKIAQGQCCR